MEKMHKIHCGPVKFLSSLRSSNPQSLITPSSPQLTNLLSLGEKLISRMLSLCPSNICRLFMFGWKYLMIPLLSPDTNQAPDFDQSSARTAVSCACRIVSKLNVSAFHRVNSPLVAPVSTLLASGVNYKKTSDFFCHLPSL
ncbi:hypothetical protein PGTUg99_025546 [Puccinia graminis f. sp. tritici]|uniref:Uncharacterized protein n=1 Tax=Puccinia graminis f. sp. tritici TaxID=56615 RepID=A0A5B0LSV3_PUCGR|nr:hypothetical protein PGTUg99_025546 [Puccinia graminis f. sp. tritici]